MNFSRVSNASAGAQGFCVILYCFPKPLIKCFIGRGAVEHEQTAIQDGVLEGGGFAY